MTFKRRGLGVQQDKAYFQVVLSQVARGSRQFEYVTEDDAATVEGASYISTATADGQLTIDEVAVGDLIWYWQVTTADDDQTIEDDKASGILDTKIYRVSDNDGTALTLENTNFGSGGTLSTSGTPVSGDLAEFVDATTVRGQTLAELDLLQSADIASGTITPRAGDINLSGGSDGNVLTVQAGGALAIEALPAAGAFVLGDATDVTLDSPADNDVLQYVTDHWENQTLAEAGIQPLDADLTAVAALTTTAAGLTTLEIADPGEDRVLAWDDTAGAVAPIALAAITAEASPASGDFFLLYGAEGDLRKVDVDDLPTGGAGTVDTSGTPVVGDLAVFTDADTIEGQTIAELDLLTVTAADAAYLPLQTIGIADNNLVEVDGSPSAAEFAVWTANGLDGQAGIDVSDFSSQTANAILATDTNGDVVDALPTHGIEVTDAGAARLGAKSLTNVTSVVAYTLTEADQILYGKVVRVANGANDVDIAVPDAVAISHAGAEWKVVQDAGHSGTVYLHREPSTLGYDNLSGTFTVGETVTDGTSGATGVVFADTGSVLSLVRVEGTFGNDNQITGGTSAATADVDGTITNGGGSINGAAYVSLAGPRSFLRAFVAVNAGTAPDVHILEGETTEDATVPGRITLNGSYAEKHNTISSSSGTLTVDLTAGNSFQVTLSENITTMTVTGVPATGTYISFRLKVIQDSTARTVAFPSGTDWEGGSGPTISTGSGDVDIFGLETDDGGTTWYGFTAGQNFS